MARRTHEYPARVTWCGNTGTGTSGYRDYARTWSLTADGKPTLFASADPAFLGDAGLWNPEDLLVAALSACHKLWYLHLCAAAGVVVTACVNDAVGFMDQHAGVGGAFTRVVPCQDEEGGEDVDTRDFPMVARSNRAAGFPELRQRAVGRE